MVQIDPLAGHCARKVVETACKANVALPIAAGYCDRSLEGRSRNGWQAFDSKHCDTRAVRPAGPDEHAVVERGEAGIEANAPTAEYLRAFK